MRRILAVAFALLATSALAADPPWTQSYSFGQSPEANGFTRTLYGTPVVTERTSGPPSGRNVEINSQNGDAIFVTSQVPSLDPAVGVTVEWRLAVAADQATGRSGDGGVALLFLSRGIDVAVTPTGVRMTICNDVGAPGQYAADTASNATATTWRLTFDGSSQVRLYREGVLVLGPYTAPTCNKHFQSVMWFGESGGTQTFSVMRYWSGGAMAP